MHVFISIILTGLPDYLINRLQRVQNSAARLVIGAAWSDDADTILCTLHWLPIKHRIDFKILVYVFKCLTKCATSYLCELLREYVPTRALRPRGHNILVIPRYKHKYGKQTFTYAAPKLWNDLPEDKQATDSLLDFRRKLKTHLFRTAFGHLL